MQANLSDKAQAGFFKVFYGPDSGPKN